jgi:hypothetical protein
MPLCQHLTLKYNSSTNTFWTQIQCLRQHLDSVQNASRQHLDSVQNASAHILDSIQMPLTRLELSRNASMPTPNTQIQFLHQHLWTQIQCLRQYLDLIQMPPPTLELSRNASTNTLDSVKYLRQHLELNAIHPPNI